MGGQEWFADSFEVMAKPVNHLSRKMHQTPNFAQSIPKWVVEDKFGIGCQSGS